MEEGSRLCGLNVQCLPQAHRLNSLSLASKTILMREGGGVLGNLGKWSLAGRSMAVAVGWGTFEGCSQSLMFFLSDLPGREQHSSHPLMALLCLASPASRDIEPIDHGLNPLKSFANKIHPLPNTHTVLPCEVFGHRDKCLNGSQEKEVRHQDLESWGCWVVSISLKDPSAHLLKQSV